MPFLSKAQIRKFGAMVKSKEIMQAKFDEWMRKTPSPSLLPERKSKELKSWGIKRSRKKKILKKYD
jgi:predicted transcriptional regulator